MPFELCYGLLDSTVAVLKPVQIWPRSDGENQTLILDNSFNPFFISQFDAVRRLELEVERCTNQGFDIDHKDHESQLEMYEILGSAIEYLRPQWLGTPR